MRLALDMVRKVVAPHTRPSAQKVLFFITDGKSNIGGSPEKAANSIQFNSLFALFILQIR